MLVAAVLMVSVACGVLALLRWQGSDVRVPPLGVALIALCCLGLAVLFAALMGQSRRPYLDALEHLRTPGERSRAIGAMWRGPVPSEPAVRRAAGLLARAHLGALRKNRHVYLWAYPLLTLSFVAQIVVAVADDEPRTALLPAVVVIMLVGSSAWTWWFCRRLDSRIRLFERLDQGATTG
jgi:hypothetical protein